MTEGERMVWAAAYVEVMSQGKGPELAVLSAYKEVLRLRQALTKWPDRDKPAVDMLHEMLT